MKLLTRLKHAAFVFLGRRIHPNQRAILLLDPAYVIPSTWTDPLNQKDFQGDTIPKQ